MPLSPGVARSAIRRSFIAALSLAALALLGLASIAAPQASAKKVVQGGISSSGLESEIPESTDPEVPIETETGEVETGEAETGPAGKARLVGTRAIAPANAPLAVKRVIAAANRIRTTPYIWGGGHRRWQDAGYDCSGSVSYALHGARMLTTPLTSGSFETWGEAGAGRWITVYANASHVYMVVAGLRFDTAGDTSGTGPRWHPTTRAAASGRFVVRHPVGY
jgi:cell wall-associated NlpC family hydrolase